MDIFLHVIHALSAVIMIVLILVQQGKGAEAGASFGAGASQTMFGSASSANMLTRATAILAVIFMLTSLALAWMVRHENRSNNYDLPGLDRVLQEQGQAADVPDNLVVPSIEGQPTDNVSDIPDLDPAE